MSTVRIPNKHEYRRLVPTYACDAAVRAAAEALGAGSKLRLTMVSLCMV